MLGGHLDSWHAATGSTDNAIGCSVMMEAARILTAIGVKPRRTIRVALWSGEEQGLLGRRRMCASTSARFEEPKPAFAKLAAYFNIDSGTGRARGLTLFGPPEAATILREALASFTDLGLLGVTTTRSRQAASTDAFSFAAAGLPGMNTLQDPIEYQSYTWHTNLDTYERVVEEDVKKSAIVIAAAVYHLAMRDDLLPRFTAEQMPRRPGAPRAGTGSGASIPNDEQLKGQMTQLTPGEELRRQFGDIDIYLFDQILRGRFDSRHRVLDAGCGDGRNLMYLLQHGFECYGVDSEPSADRRRSPAGVASCAQPAADELRRRRRHEASASRRTHARRDVQRRAALRER